MVIIGELLALFKALCFALTAISFEFAGKRVGSMAVNIIRLFFAFVLLGITLLFMKGYFIPLDATLNQWSLLVISGFVGMVLGDLFLFQAFVDVGGRISLLIMALVPPISALLGFLFLHEVISAIDLLGMTITIFSIVMVIAAKKQKEVILSRHVIRGIILN